MAQSRWHATMCVISENLFSYSCLSPPLLPTGSASSPHPLSPQSFLLRWCSMQLVSGARVWGLGWRMALFNVTGINKLSGRLLAVG